MSETIERARERAREEGELLDPPTEPFRSPLPPDVQAVLREWRDSGDFDRALAEVIADDPELADQLTLRTRTNPRSRGDRRRLRGGDAW